MYVLVHNVQHDIMVKRKHCAKKPSEMYYTVCLRFLSGSPSDSVRLREIGVAYISLWCVCVRACARERDYDMSCHESKICHPDWKFLDINRACVPRLCVLF